jgi:SsrA-binding protein
VATKVKKNASRYKEVRNAKAFHEYEISDRYECGIVLTGTEVKSIRAGKAQIAEGYIRVEKGQVNLYNAYIDEYNFGNFNNHNPKRPRRLLLHRREINKLDGAVQSGGFTIVPLKLYFKEALVKIEIALGKGKKLYDKRQTERNKEAARETQRLRKEVFKIN